MRDLREISSSKLLDEMDDLAELRHRTDWKIVAPMAVSLIGIFIGLCALPAVFMRSSWPARVIMLIGAASVALLYCSLRMEKAKARRLDDIETELRRRRNDT